jgi:hypothetical protein
MVAHTEGVTLEVESILEQEIQRGQLEEVEIKEIKETMERGKTSDFTEDDQEIIWFKNRILLMDKRRIHLRSASIWTYTFFTMGFPMFLSIRGATGLQAFDLPLLTYYLNPIYD